MKINNARHLLSLYFNGGVQLLHARLTLNCLFFKRFLLLATIILDWPPKIAQAHRYHRQVQNKTTLSQ